MSKKIVLTGGGTAGHINPNLALIPSLLDKGFDVNYIGSTDGMEARLVKDYPVSYFGVASGKIRRSLSLSNLKTPAKVALGTAQSRKILSEIKPDIVFSKGGYVSVPVTTAAASLKIPYIIHESDLTPGLANRYCQKKAAKICCNFPETLLALPPNKAVLTGLPIRAELRKGDKLSALRLCGFSANIPVLLVTGGSQGASTINKAVRDCLDELLVDFQVVHLCGKDKIDNNLLEKKGYKQFEYLRSEMKDVLAMADIVVSRAGANTICELLALKKPHLLIPLAGQTRGDQVQNAGSFEASGYSMVVTEQDLKKDLNVLVENIRKLYFNRQTFISAMGNSIQSKPVDAIMSLIMEIIGKKY